MELLEVSPRSGGFSAARDDEWWCLENELAGEHHHATGDSRALERAVCAGRRRDRAGNEPKPRSRDVLVRNLEVRVVEQIGRCGADLNVHALAQCELLVERGVDISIARPVERIPSYVAEIGLAAGREKLRSGEARGVHR